MPNIIGSFTSQELINEHFRRVREGRDSNNPLSDDEIDAELIKAMTFANFHRDENGNWYPYYVLMNAMLNGTAENSRDEILSNWLEENSSLIIDLYIEEQWQAMRCS